MHDAASSIATQNSSEARELNNRKSLDPGDMQLGEINALTRSIRIETPT